MGHPGAEVEASEEASVRSLLHVASRVARFAGWSVDVATGQARWSEDLHLLFDTEDVDLSLDEGLTRFFGDEAQTRIRAAIERCGAQGEPFDLEVEARTAERRDVVLRIVAHPERDADGTIVRVAGAVQDVTERARADAELLATAQRLREAWESTSDGVFILDAAWRLAYVNRRAAEVFGAPADRLLGRHAWDLASGPEAAAFRRLYERVRATGEPDGVTQVYYAPLDGWFQINVYPAGDGVAVYFRDVTEARAGRERLEERERRLAEQAELLDLASDAIHVRDLRGEVTYWNRGAERLHGHAAADAVGRRIHDLAPAVDGAVGLGEAVARTEGAWSGEVRLRHADGTERTVEARYTLLRDDDGYPRSLLVLETDVTGRRRVEAQVQRTQRLESLGTLAGGMAHDLNNVLAPITLATQLLLDDADDPRDRELLEVVLDAADRGRDLVRQVLTFARGGGGERREVALDRTVDEVLRIVGETLPREVALRTATVEDLPPVLGDPTHLHQLVMNLVVNARDAVRDGGTVSVTLDRVDLDAELVATSATLRPGPHVRLVVRDDGPGVPPEVAERIFEPFFTTKASGDGTGLGLSTSLTIADAHGGTLELEPGASGGATFVVTLPAVLGGQAPAVPDDLPPQRRGRGELVLVVDDEGPIRRTASATLTGAGYRVVVAEDGAEAVGLAADHLDDLALVVTDVTMPVLDGIATVHALRWLRADLPVIVVSGRHDDHELASRLPDGVDAALAKPFTAAALLRTVREVLDAAEQVRT